MKKIKLLTLSKKYKKEIANTEKPIQKSEYRVQVLKKIEELEKQGKFDVDAEDDPPTIVLTPENIDYLRKKTSSKLKRVFANEMGEKFLDNLLKNNKLIIKQINGMENLSKISTGAIVTCNHFNPFDCFTIEKVFRLSGKIEEKIPVKVGTNVTSLEDFGDEAPVLPQDDEYDLQKELEAKFDELFGPIDE